MENQQSLVLLLGSNSGDRKSILEQCIVELQKKAGEIIHISSIYESKAWGFDGYDFLNQVIILKTSQSAEECLTQTQEIEKKLGRIKKSIDGQYENRAIDIDILFWGDEIIDEKHLKIPHPRMTERMFTMAPLNELIPEFSHPQLNKTIHQLFSECVDENEVIKLHG